MRYVTLSPLIASALCASVTPRHRFQHPMPEDRRKPFFPRLEHLDMECTIEFSMWMLAHMWETPLDTLILTFATTPAVTNWQTLFRAIHDQIPHDYLRVVDITLNCWRAYNVGFTMKQLSPLLSFTKLTRVSLGGYAALDDDAVTTMALAWPHLKLLDIYGVPLKSSQSVTFKGLANLARCQALEEEFASPVN